MRWISSSSSTPAAKGWLKNRSHCYRWVGDREQLIGLALATLSDQAFVVADKQVKAAGLDRALSEIRASLPRRGVDVSARNGSHVASSPKRASAASKSRRCVCLMEFPSPQSRAS